MQETWDKQRELVQTHCEGIANILIEAFSKSEGFQNERSRMKAKKIIKDRQKEKKWKFDITTFAPYILIGNDYIFTTLNVAYEKNPHHKPDELELERHVVFAKALEFIFAAP